MSIQRDVVKEQIKLKIGNIYDTIIDSNNGEYFIGRSYEMAPEIDGLIYIKKHKGINIGDKPVFDVLIPVPVVSTPNS